MKKRISFNDLFVVISSPLQKQIRICTFTVSLPQRREIFNSINIWSGLSHLEKTVEEEINSKSPDLLLVSGSLYRTQKYWDRFPREAQGSLVPAGLLPQCMTQLCYGTCTCLCVQPGLWVGLNSLQVKCTCLASATKTSHLSFHFSPWIVTGL